MIGLLAYISGVALAYLTHPFIQAVWLDSLIIGTALSVFGVSLIWRTSMPCSDLFSLIIHQSCRRGELRSPVKTVAASKPTGERSSPLRQDLDLNGNDRNSIFKSQVSMRIYVIMAALLAGMLTWQNSNYRQLQHELSPSLTSPITVKVIARINALPQPETYGTSVNLVMSHPKIMTSNTLDAANKSRHVGAEGVTLDIANKPYQIDNVSKVLNHQIVHVLWMKPPIALWPGQRWSLTLRLRPLHGFQNPGSFNYPGWLRAEHIAAVGSVLQGQLLASTIKPDFFMCITQFRAYLRQRQQAILPLTPLSGILTALSLGDKSEVPLAVQQLFIHTGTAHLLAISGLHVGLIASLAYGLSGYLWRFIPRCCLYMPANLAAWGFSLMAAWGYALLAGLSVSTERAAIMITALAACMMLRLRFSWLMIWLWVLAIILLINPLSINQSGLWLSFLAVAGLGYLGLHRPQRWPKIYQWLFIQILLGLLLAPLMLALFQQVSLIAIPANLVAIPWIGTIIVPLTLVATLSLWLWPLLGKVLLLLALHLLTGFWPTLAYLNALPHVTWYGGVSSLTALVLGLWGCLWLLAPRAVPLRPLSLGFLLPACLNPGPSLTPNALRLTVLDVGQGLATVIQTKNHTLVYDTGPGDPAGFNAGSAVMVPFMRDVGIHQLNRAILSHGDNDHIAGLPALLNAYPTADLLSSDPKRIQQVLQLSQAIALCHSGLSWRWDGVSFKMLYPGMQDLGQNNNSSCVLQVSVAGKRILLTGDLEQRALQTLLRQYGSSLVSQVLIVPHHGSAGAAWPPFIMTVAPQYAIFPSSYMNRFRFPRTRVLALYSEQHAHLFNTGLNGSITVQINARGMITVTDFKSG